MRGATWSNKLSTSLSQLLLIILFLIALIGVAFIIQNERLAIQRDMQQRLEMMLQILEVAPVGQQSLARNKSSKASLLGLLAIQQAVSIQVDNVQDGQSIFAVQSNDTDEAAANWLQKILAVPPLELEKQSRFPLFSTVVEQQLLIQVHPRFEHDLVRQRLQIFLALMLAMIVFICASTFSLLSNLASALTRVKSSIADIEFGNYSTRLSGLYFSELDAIAAAYNSAMDRLERVRQENRTLAERLLRVQENERQMLAQELHDELGQSISGIKVMCVSMSASATPANKLKLKSVTDICDHLYTVVRDLMRELRPAILDELGLKTALEEIVETWQQRNSDLEIFLNCDNSVDAFNDTLTINLYRIVQESLTNIIKYAQAEKVTISLTESINRSKPWVKNTFVHLKITDDGKGFDTNAKRLGFGLIGIRERVKSLAGTMLLNSAPGQGTSIIIEIPNRLQGRQEDAH